MAPPSYKCNCYAYLNLYIEKCGYHFRYFNHQKFLEDYQEWLTSKNYTSEEINQLSVSLKQLQDEKKEEDHRAFERYQNIQKLYKPLHAQIFTFDESYLDSNFKQLVSQCRKTTLASSQLQHLKLSDDVDVYKFKVFTPDFISLLLQELDHINAFPGLTLGRPNSMNHNGVLMKELGLDDLLSVVREQYLQPIVDSAFPAIGQCDSHRAFTVKYNADSSASAAADKGDKQLGLHYDNAEVTINVCLQADDCQGSDLMFLGVADGTEISEEELRKEKLHVKHEVGQGIFHLGRQRHYVTPILRGVRTNLVMWLRSSSYRNQECPMCWQEPEPVPTKFFDDGFRP